MLDLVGVLEGGGAKGFLSGDALQLLLLPPVSLPLCRCAYVSLQVACGGGGRLLKTMVVGLCL